jgi:voltage-gated potassium channel
MTGQKISSPVSFTSQQTSVVLGLGLLAFWTLMGTLGFILIEGWSLGESLYMTVITISTVGFGEVHPLSSEGRLFASFLIVTGIGTAIYTFTRLGQVVLEGGSLYRLWIRQNWRAGGSRPETGRLSGLYSGQ